MTRAGSVWAIVFLLAACHEGDPHYTTDPMAGAWQVDGGVHPVYFHEQDLGSQFPLDATEHDWDAGTWVRDHGVLRIGDQHVCEDHASDNVVILTWLADGTCEHPGTIERRVTLTRAPYSVKPASDTGATDRCFAVPSNE